MAKNVRGLIRGTVIIYLREMFEPRILDIVEKKFSLDITVFVVLNDIRKGRPSFPHVFVAGDGETASSIYARGVLYDQWLAAVSTSRLP